MGGASTGGEVVYWAGLQMKAGLQVSSSLSDDTRGSMNSLDEPIN